MKRKGRYQLAIFFAVAICLPATVIARKGMGIQPAGFTATVAAKVGATPYEYYNYPGACFGRGRMGMMCHGDKFRFGQKVKGTYTEWLNSPYYPATRCQDCHQRSGGMMMGMHRRDMYSMNFKGGFSPWVEGVASLRIAAPAAAVPGRQIDFTITVTNDWVGHEFPSGSMEERQLWLHVTAHDEAGNSWHIPVATTPNETDPSNPNHIYWVTTNAVVAWPSPNPEIAVPIARDALEEGDRLYHSVLISPAYTGSKITYAQYYADRIYSNRLKPGKPRVENYSWSIPPDAAGSVAIRAALNYRRMPDSMADYLKIMRRPIVRVSAAGAVVTLK